MVKVFGFVVVFVSIVFGAWWIKSSPPSYIKISPAFALGKVSPQTLAVTANEDVIAKSVTQIALELPGYDEIVLFKDQNFALATGIDGWFWKIDFKTQTAKRFVDAPLMPAGARIAPDNSNIVYFCSSFLYDAVYPQNERVGLYQLNLTNKQITPLVLEVPQVSGIGLAPEVFAIGDGVGLSTPLLKQSTSRPLAFCNDLDVSADGQRIYFTEPFSYENASMGGGGTYREAVSLGQNGLVWLYDFDSYSVSLISKNFTFPDGILVESNEYGEDQSLLIAETVKFQIQRMFISGSRSGQSEIVQKDMPAMPDGLDRDANGNIWVGMIKQRSGTIDWIHKNPWIKQLLLRLPVTMMPVSRETSYMALSENGETVLFYSVHDGSVFTEISVVIPGNNQLYLATVGHDSKGLYSVPYPEALQNE
ncbi:MAG: SMP-30/gluconolactonase/LRE family protein [Robiginitomaculum sp.]|nr:SMP-30/gluconolactonase/LRE family protein [Robiginitomaculum sp.]